MKDAFDMFFKAWKEDNPQAEEYLPFDLQDFFLAGMEAFREVIWHSALMQPESRKTIVAWSEGDCEISYGGGQVLSGHWAYASDLFSEEMMDELIERETEIAAWQEAEKRQEFPEYPD